MYFRKHPYVALKEIAKRRIKAGESKQEVYDSMAPTTKYKHALAIFVANQPALDRKSKHLWMTWVCFIMAGLYATFFGLIAFIDRQAVPGREMNAMMWLTAFIMLIIAFGMLSRSSGRFYTQYCAVMVFGFAQAPRFIIHLPIVGLVVGAVILSSMTLAMVARNRIFGRINFMAGAVKVNGRYVVTPVG
jgi:cytochrome c-type biogenesis protein CcmH/NrfF